MIDTVRDWLPDDALLRPSIQARLATVVETWSTQWYIDRRLTAQTSRRLTISAQAETVVGEHRLIRDNLILRCPANAAIRLVGWALDIGLDQLELADADRILIEKFESAMLSDLADRLESFLKPSPATQEDDVDGRSEGLGVTLGEASGVGMLLLSLTASTAFGLCRSTLTERAQSSRALTTSLVTALASTPVEVEAALGRASVSVPDLRRLAPGDVLVLDRRLDQPAALGLAANGGVFAQAELTNTSSPFILTLRAAPVSRVA